jgi:hypothetical protein
VPVEVDDEEVEVLLAEEVVPVDLLCNASVRSV